MKEYFEIKKSWIIELDEEEFIETIKEAMEDFPAPDSDNLKDWVSEILFEDSVRDIHFLNINGYWETLNSLSMYSMYNTCPELTDKIRDMLQKYLLDYIKKEK